MSSLVNKIDSDIKRREQTITLTDEQATAKLNEGWFDDGNIGIDMDKGLDTSEIPEVGNIDRDEIKKRLSKIKVINVVLTLSNLDIKVILYKPKTVLTKTGIIFKSKDGALEIKDNDIEKLTTPSRSTLGIQLDRSYGEVIVQYKPGWFNRVFGV